MKILHVVPTYYPAVRYGGPIKSVHELCRALVKLGHEVHVFTTSVDGPRDLNVQLGVPVDVDGVKVWYFPSRRLRRFYWSPEMKRELEAKMASFDIVHLHSVFLWPTWIAARIAERKGVPYGVSPRGMLVKELIRRKSRWIKTAWILLVERHTLERASFIHATSALEATEFINFGFKSKTLIDIPNGLDRDNSLSENGPEHPAMPGAMGNEPFILFLGRVNWKKGLDRLIEALIYVPKVKLVIAGNDEENYRAELESIITRVGVKDRVVFTGPVYGDEKSALLRAASVFVLPSYSENFGNVVLEAMAEGCPVVVTAEVGLAQVVGESGVGVVAPVSPALLGGEIARLLGDPVLCAEMGRRGKSLVADKFTWEAVARQMEQAYRAVVPDVGPHDVVAA